ncbi:hypothetical protein ACFSQP_12600 [Bizionia sediminis]|uniref:Uncharacterized protein n=1 Tax=Bizionia sediminis TaxID=1737064 RepID=A0ABW5KVY7_9FLAO
MRLQKERSFKAAYFTTSFILQPLMFGQEGITTNAAGNLAMLEVAYANKGTPLP